MKKLSGDIQAGTSGPAQGGDLDQELRRFCDQLGQQPPDAGLLTAYRNANATVFASAVGAKYESQKRILQKALAANRDLEALEYAWRFVQHDNILTKKMHIFMYLLETSPGHYDQFINDYKQQTKAFLVLGLQVLRSACKLLTGCFSYITLKAGA